MSHSTDSSRRRKSARQAAVFVDGTSLIGLLERALPPDVTPDSYLLPLLTRLRTSLQRRHHLQTTLFRAYGDFSTERHPDPSVLHALYAGGAEPRFLEATAPHDTALRLCIDVMKVLLTQPETQTIVLVSGDQAYLPLLRQIRERGRQAVLATLRAPRLPEDVDWTEEALPLDLGNLLDEPMRRHLYTVRPDAAPPRRPLSFTRIEDPTTLVTLEVIEEHFGQYDEIYLTPLLRKLSEVFDDPAYDPKEIIGRLEEAHAVRLEKRHGTPYDYTVLIMEPDHPDVQLTRERVYEAIERATGYDADDADGDDLEYEEDAYDDAYDDFEDDDFEDGDLEDGDLEDDYEDDYDEDDYEEDLDEEDFDGEDFEEEDLDEDDLAEDYDLDGNDENLVDEDVYDPNGAEADAFTIETDTDAPEDERNDERG
ncbi:hypothetical protein AWN76_004015 [Rhodothermaceae bacterium RA]|nr:hypothetical protein AWN76_004015 [Rhodothermaceae bacterium RA]